MTGKFRLNCASDGCEPRIPLFPLRYSVHPRKVGDARFSNFAAAGFPLESSFTPLPNAVYDLRCIGAGFVYLIDETKGDFFVWKVDREQGQFIELLAKTRTLDEVLSNYKEGNKVPYLWARQGSRVHLMLTDTLLTSARLRDLQINKDGLLAKLATTIDVAAWSEEVPSKNTFPAMHIAELVEEYQQAECNFSPWKVKPYFARAEALVQSMKAVASAAQIAVVMYDHIALVQDLSGIFHDARQQLERYTTTQETSDGGGLQRFRKKAIADLIDRIYEAAYAEGKGKTAPDALGRAIQNDIEEREWKRQQYARNVAAMGRDPRADQSSVYRSSKEFLDSLPNEPIGQRAAVLAEGAKRYSQHVNEAERVAFLKSFSSDITRLQGVVIDHKNDRFLWLKNYSVNTVASDFGCAFLRYDVNNPLSSTSHALAFSSCIEGMIWGPGKAPLGKVDQERELFDQWWKLPWQVNPILSNMAHDQGLGETIWANKADVSVDNFGKVLAPLLRFGAVHLLMEQVGVYTLYRAPQNGAARVWHGAARDAVANRIHQLAGTGTLADANRLVEILERRYQDRLDLRRLSYQEAFTWLERAQGLPEGALVRGSIAMGAGDSMEVLVWTRTTPLTRYANPFLQVFERGVAGGVAVLSLWNLKTAAVNLQGGYAPDQLASKTNFAAAIMGTSSAVNGLMAATRSLIPALYSRASFSGAALSWLSGRSATRLFGYVGAALDAITNWFKAWGQYQKGNTDAATYYALAGVGLGLGAAALTVGGAGIVGGAGMATAVSIAGGLLVLPVWGWIAAGLVLLGAGLWLMLKGDKAQYNELDFWLSDGSFGKRELLGREKESQATYGTLDDENRGYVMACYAPQKVDADWSVLDYEVAPHYAGSSLGVMMTYSPRLQVEVVYPLAGEVCRVAAIQVGEVTPGSTPVSESRMQFREQSSKPLPSGGTLRSYVITGLKSNEEFYFSLIASYTPSLLGERLEKRFSFSNADTPWYY